MIVHGFDAILAAMLPKSRIFGGLLSIWLDEKMPHKP
jgi:hypothetical protein